MADQDSSGQPRVPDGSAPDPVAQTGDLSQWTWLARIRRPQGRKGEVFADILTDFPEKFSDRRRLWLIPDHPTSSPAPMKGMGFSPYNNPQTKSGALAPAGNKNLAPREVSLENNWLHKGGIILHFSGINSISDAETLAGLIVAIPQTERAPLPDDETYISDLIGCTLVDVAKTALQAAGKIEPQIIGIIEEVDRTAGPVALLVIRGQSGEILIPFAKSYLRKIDLPAKRVEMSLPEGLVDLNAPDKP